MMCRLSRFAIFFLIMSWSVFPLVVATVTAQQMQNLGEEVEKKLGKLSVSEFSRLIATFPKSSEVQASFRRVKAEAAILTEYERLARWLEEGRLSEPAAKEAREILVRQSRRMFEGMKVVLTETEKILAFVEEFVPKFDDDYGKMVQAMIKNPQSIVPVLPREEEMVLGEIRASSLQLTSSLQDVKPGKPVRQLRQDVQAQSQKMKSSAPPANVIGSEGKPSSWLGQFVRSSLKIALGISMVGGDLYVATQVPGTVGVAVVSCWYGKELVANGVETITKLP